jgi:hypothetical protein
MGFFRRILQRLGQEAEHKRIAAENFARQQAELEAAAQKHRDELAAQIAAQELADRQEAERVTRERKAQQEKADRQKKALAEEEARRIAAVEAIQRPIRALQIKLDSVNARKLAVGSNPGVALLGLSGLCKSTFRWLRYGGPKPEQSDSDGTVKIEHVGSVVDCIGLRAWSMEDVAKVIVLLLETGGGLPADLIIFSNDRINEPLTHLAKLGIVNPMATQMHSTVWDELEPADPAEARIRIVERAASAAGAAPVWPLRTLEPASELKRVYNLPSMAKLQQTGTAARFVTHHDDIEQLVKERQQAGIRPFEHLRQELGSVCHFNHEGDSPTKTIIFQLTYLFEHKYQRNALNFMQNATVQEFHTLQ